MSGENTEIPGSIKFIDAVRPFLFGGLSGIVATTCIQPLDTIKVRIQCTGIGESGIQGSLFRTGGALVRDEGFMALYSGYSAAVLRQAVYGTARLGLFQKFSQAMQKDEHSPISFPQKVGAGLASGALGSVIGNPCDLALVRMQADGQLPPEARRNYSNAFSAIARIAREEGVATLWRGSQPSVARAMAMNVGMLATHSQAKELLLPVFGEGNATRFLSSALAGVTAACVTLPFDLIKTRIQSMRPDARGKLPYSGILDCARKVTMQEGTFALWKGLGTFCVRVAPHAVITLMVMDNMNEAYDGWRKRKLE